MTRFAERQSAVAQRGSCSSEVTSEWPTKCPVLRCRAPFVADLKVTCMLFLHVRAQSTIKKSNRYLWGPIQDAGSLLQVGYAMHIDGYDSMSLQLTVSSVMWVQWGTTYWRGHAAVWAGTSEGGVTSSGRVLPFECVS